MSVVVSMPSRSLHVDSRSTMSLPRAIASSTGACSSDATEVFGGTELCFALALWRALSFGMLL